MGWGGYTHRGPPEVDHQMASEVPITLPCDDKNKELICTGYEEGGVGACPGKIKKILL